MDRCCLFHERLGWWNVLTTLPSTAKRASARPCALRSFGKGAGGAVKGDLSSARVMKGKVRSARASRSDILAVLIIQIRLVKSSENPRCNCSLSLGFIVIWLLPVGCMKSLEIRVVNVYKKKCSSDNR